MSLKSPTRRALLLLGVIAVAVLAVVVYVAIPGSNRPAPQKLRVGYMRISAALPYFVAEDRKLFAKHSVQVEAIPYTTGLQLLNDLADQKIDAAVTGPVDVLLAREIEKPGRFKLILNVAFSPNSPIFSIVARKDSPIQSSQDLKGKSIAAPAGVTMPMLISLLLEQRHGYKRDADFKVIGVAPGQQLDVLRAKEYDAGILLEPLGSVASTSSDLRVVEWGPIEREVMNPLPIVSFSVSTTAIKEHATATKNFTAAIDEAVGIIKSDPQAARSLLVSSMNLTPEQARICGIGTFLTVEQRGQANLQGLSDLLTKQGVLKGRVDVSSLYFQP